MVVDTHGQHVIQPRRDRHPFVAPWIVATKEYAVESVPVSTFGTPPTKEGIERFWHEVWETQGEPPNPDPGIGDMAIQGIRTLLRSGRYGSITSLSFSNDIQPGDLIGLRSIMLLDQIEVWLQSMRIWASSGGDVDVRSPIETLHSAKLYYVPPAATVPLVSSEPPDDEVMGALRLPGRRITVWFGHIVEVMKDLVLVPEEFDARFEDREQYRPEWLKMKDPTSGAEALLRAVRANEAVGLFGVTLFADESYRLLPHAAWYVATDGDAGTRWGVARGYWPRSTLADVVKNVAASVGWAAWDTPPLGRKGVSEEEWKKADGKERSHLERSSAFKRSLASGALAGVRILNVGSVSKRGASGGPGPAGGSGRLSPAPHFRRGHWRSVRVGPRNDWHYEARWFPPTQVEPHGPFRAGEVVYRLPSGLAQVLNEP